MNCRFSGQNLFTVLYFVVLYKKIAVQNVTTDTMPCNCSVFYKILLSVLQCLFETSRKTVRKNFSKAALYHYQIKHFHRK